MTKIIVGLTTALAVIAMSVTATSAFVSHGRNGRISQPHTILSLMPLDVAGVETIGQQRVVQAQFVGDYQQGQPESALQVGIRNYAAASWNAGPSSSTMVLSLKDRPPPPTAEELAAKKRNFNLWFWGGGFVAPFLATFYYFGFKFWEK
jgi:hypothetical protein